MNQENNNNLNKDAYLNNQSLDEIEKILSSEDTEPLVGVDGQVYDIDSDLLKLKEQITKSLMENLSDLDKKIEDN